MLKSIAFDAIAIVVSFTILFSSMVVAQEASSRAAASTVRVAGIVLKWLRTDKQANYRRVEPMIRKAAAEGAQVVCTTEGFLEGYAIADKSIPLEKFRSLGEQIPGGEYFGQLRQLADELDIHLIAGMLQRDGKHLYNAAVVIGPDGKLIGKYHKQQLGHEAVRITAGGESSVFETPFGKVGVMICADRTKQDIVKRFCTGGADLLICPSGGMFGSKKNDPIVQARSRENGKFILFVHPAEFLVTGPAGQVVMRTIVGDRLRIDPREVGSRTDSSGIYFFDVPLPDAAAGKLPTSSINQQTSRESLTEMLQRPILEPDTSHQELMAVIEASIPQAPKPASREDWETQASQIRQGMLDRILLAGEAAGWRDAPSRVEWFDTIAGDADYRIRKFRYEALPGFWIPALLYEPTRLADKMPVFINVNGHHQGGKAMPYKQRRCINLAKRGMLAYNLEFINMGQLQSDKNDHSALPQIDLCGTSGVAPFYLTMTRGLDVALAHEHADRARVGVAGLSGGGWQTIFLASLDSRITLANPVAGFSSMFSRTKNTPDFGDSEQIPSDMCTVADYTHLTALVAPRPLLLTYNSKDNCCFLPPEVLPELEEAARPIYQLYGRENNFQTHINDDPGTHNFESDNREALYRLLKDHFYAGDDRISTADVPIPDTQLKSAEELAVPMPEHNATLNSLAIELSKSLPARDEPPGNKQAAQAWQADARKCLGEITCLEQFQGTARSIEQSESEGLTTTRWVIDIKDTWKVPVVEFCPTAPVSTVVLIGDEGRAELAASADRYLALNRRVVLVDLLGFGEASAIKNTRAELQVVATVGRRLLGIQSAELAAIGSWLRKRDSSADITIDASGPRNGIIALIAAAMEPEMFSGVELHQSWGSLKELITQNMKAGDAPELFCFGLLKHFDIAQMVALVAPRPVTFNSPDEQVRSQLGDLKRWYAVYDKIFDPLQ